ncbi:MAG TPA: TIGR02391 family protein [Bacillota bacterium]|nr:TIGR02391 family protein [Bacillota bacterium]
MNNRIDKDLWNAIKDSYEKESYTNVITNAMMYINEVVQEKSGLEGLDNTKLMDNALLGKAPKLLVNKNQTQSEKDIQQGVGFILKGMCLSIRNPRSHERYNDTKKNADEIILFINYILSLLNKNISPHLVEDWVEFILDEHFNCSEKNAADVFDKIPDKKKYDVLTGVLRRREEICDDNDLTQILTLLYESLSPEQNDELVSAFNRELAKTNVNEQLYNFFKVFPNSNWSDLDVIARNRIEGMVLKSIEKATVIYEENFGDYYMVGYCDDAKLAIAAVSYIVRFGNKGDVLRVLVDKLFSDDSDERAFIDKYYMQSFDNYSSDEIAIELKSNKTFEGATMLGSVEKNSDDYNTLLKILPYDTVDEFVLKEDEMPF